MLSQIEEVLTSHLRRKTSGLYIAYERPLESARDALR